jgi:hypothetical protein
MDSELFDGLGCEQLAVCSRVVGSWIDQLLAYQRANV